MIKIKKANQIHDKEKGVKIIEDKLCPVSYTHLDVYKRQLL